MGIFILFPAHVEQSVLFVPHDVHLTSQISQEVPLSYNPIVQVHDGAFSLELAQTIQLDADS